MLEDIAKEIRKDIMIAAYRGGAGHLASAFSAVEIMTALYFGDVLKYDKNNFNWEDRDKLIVSKGHASLVLYSVLKRIGYISQEELYSFCQPGSLLGGEPKYGDTPGVEATTGSLGHGLSFAVGIALANKIDKRPNRIYVLLGDGECQEGSVWEAALSAPTLELDNLTVIVDHNKLQAMDKLENIVKMHPFAEKWKAFGWNVLEIDGHSVRACQEAFLTKTDKPLVVIASTVKGKGISFMENQPEWHFGQMTAKQFEQAWGEIINDRVLF